MPEESNVIYWRPSKSAGFTGDLIQVMETQRREWDNQAKKFNPVWIIEIDEGTWKPFHDPAIIEMMRSNGKNMFPSTELTLRFMTESDQEIRWTIDIGYKNNVKPLGRALEKASDGMLNLAKAYSLQEKADAIATVFGGKELTVQTPSFDMAADKVTVIRNLLAEGWWTIDDIIEGRTGRKPYPREGKSDDEIIALRANEGFVGRPYRITVQTGHHTFQGFSSFESYLAERARRESERGSVAAEPASLYDEDLPF